MNHRQLGLTRLGFAARLFLGRLKVGGRPPFDLSGPLFEVASDGGYSACELLGGLRPHFAFLLQPSVEIARDFLHPPNDIVS